MLATLIALHVLAAVFWVGGMAFAYFILRPAAGPLDPPVRLALWRRVFGSFLPLVGLSILVLLASGYGMLVMMFGGFRAAPVYVHVMQGIGILMTLLYLHLLFAPWKRFQAALDAGAPPEAAKSLNQIRIIVAINLALGIITIAIGAGGRLW
ncbi:MAG: CopD family protein [Xanthobacteraceae bacterium]